MKNKLSNAYHDYVFKNGKFVGAFEEMYQNVDDPWHHGNATAIHYDLALLLLKRYVNLHRGRVLDLGCGKGAFTARLKGNFPNAKVIGVDVAPTAIRKARRKYGHLGIEFRVLDVRECQRMAEEAGSDFELTVMFDLMWYVLPEFENIVRHLGKIVRKGGWLLVNQTFYNPDKQKYGRAVISSVEDMLKLIPYKVVEIIEINRFSNHHAIVLFQVETQEMRNETITSR